MCRVDHEAIKRDPMTYLRCTKPVRNKSVRTDEDAVTELGWWRNCACGSTLVRPLGLAVAA